MMFKIKKKRYVFVGFCALLATFILFVHASFAKENNYEKTVENNIASDFYLKKIDDKLFERIKGKSYKENSTIPVSDLRYLHILHKDLNGKTLEGEIICNAYIANHLLDIFKKLYLANYPIERVRLVDEYDANDEISMQNNNTSSFNFRFISKTNRVSKHGFGLAIDINPLYNPYVKEINGELYFEPSTAFSYIDRTRDFAYKIDENDLAYKLFIEHGFEWGGDWKRYKDYQHFEIPSEIVNKLYKN